MRVGVDKEERAPTREEARSIMLGLHQPGGEFYNAVRRAVGDEVFEELLPQERLALQSWAHQQGSPNFEAFFRGEDGPAMLEAIRTWDRDEIRRLWHSPDHGNETRKIRDLFLYFNGIAPAFRADLDRLTHTSYMAPERGADLYARATARNRWPIRPETEAVFLRHAIPRGGSAVPPAPAPPARNLPLLPDEADLRRLLRR